MSVLSDADLIRIYPGCPLEPASVNLHLGDSLLVWPEYVRRDPRIDQADRWQAVGLEADERGPCWVLRPGWRYLATTRERIAIRRDLAGQIGARSSWGRDGLAVILGPAGWLDPGYSGRPTLELSVTGSELVVWPGAEVCQLVLHTLETPSERPYDHPSRRSKYQGDEAPTPSRLHREARP